MKTYSSIRPYPSQSVPDGLKQSSTNPSAPLGDGWLDATNATNADRAIRPGMHASNLDRFLSVRRRMRKGAKSWTIQKIKKRNLVEERCRVARERI